MSTKCTTHTVYNTLNFKILEMVILLQFTINKCLVTNLLVYCVCHVVGVEVLTHRSYVTQMAFY